MPPIKIQIRHGLVASDDVNSPPGRAVWSDYKVTPGEIAVAADALHDLMKRTDMPGILIVRNGSRVEIIVLSAESVEDARNAVMARPDGDEEVNATDVEAAKSRNVLSEPFTDDVGRRPARGESK